MNRLKEALKKTPVMALYKFGIFCQWKLSDWTYFWKWIKSGRRGAAPHCVKVRTVKEYAERFGLLEFVETGTYLGQMVDAVKGNFQKVHSIELLPEFSQKAKLRFSRYSHVSIYHGESGDVLPEVLKKITEPCLFWLDAHFSGDGTARGEEDTPILREIGHICKHPIADRHVILIDDARCFIGKNGYPILEELFLMVSKIGDYHVENRNDIIRINKVVD